MFCIEYIILLSLEGVSSLEKKVEPKHAPHQRSRLILLDMADEFRLSHNAVSYSL